MGLPGSEIPQRSSLGFFVPNILSTKDRLTGCPSEADDSVMAAARAVLAPVMDSAAMTAMPVFSSGQTGLQAHDTYAGLGSADLIHTAGGGIFGHPGGVAAGVQSFLDAWQAAQEGIELERAALDSPALAQALGFWR